jgi:hypothetical protein
VPRPVRHEIDTLLSEARAIELLADDADIPPEKLQDYWNLSAELMNLVVDIEEQKAEWPAAPADDPSLVELRHRLRSVAARLAEMSLE